MMKINKKVLGHLATNWIMTEIKWDTKSFKIKEF